MDRSHCYRSFADRTGNPFDRAGAHVTGAKTPGRLVSNG